MRVRRPTQNQTPERSGAALVETALVLPIFFMVVLGIIEFGRAMMVAQLLNNGAREGARIAIMTGSTNTAVETAVLDFVEDAVGVARAEITVTITVTAAPGNPDPANDVANANKRDLCEILVEVPFDEVDFLPGDFLNNRDLSGQCAMRHE